MKHYGNCITSDYWRSVGGGGGGNSTKHTHTCARSTIISHVNVLLCGESKLSSIIKMATLRGASALVKTVRPFIARRGLSTTAVLASKCTVLSLFLQFVNVWVDTCLSQQTVLKLALLQTIVVDIGFPRPSKSDWQQIVQFCVSFQFVFFFLH